MWFTAEAAAILRSNDLRSFTATASYLDDDTYGLSLSHFKTRGRRDVGLNAPDPGGGDASDNDTFNVLAWAAF